jgi:hypothetical protein
MIHDPLTKKCYILAPLPFVDTMHVNATHLSRIMTDRHFRLKTFFYKVKQVKWLLWTYELSTITEPNVNIQCFFDMLYRL